MSSWSTRRSAASRRALRAQFQRLIVEELGEAQIIQHFAFRDNLFVDHNGDAIHHRATKVR